MNPLAAVLIRIALTALGAGVAILPRSFEMKAGPFLGRLLLLVDPKRRRIALDNISHCLPELGIAGWDRLLKKNYEHYGILVFELLHMFSPFPGHYPRYVRRVSVLEGVENWKKAHEKGKGVLFVSAHLANWELMCAIGALSGIPLTLVTRHLKPEWVHLKVEDARRSTRVRAAYLPNTLPPILKALRHGESIGLAVDQYAPPPMGIPVPFFGVKADTLAAVGTLAQRYGAAIVPARQVRTPDGIVHIYLEQELDLGPLLRDAEKTTTAITAKVEAWIRANPEQWLWVHRRFKNVAWPQAAPGQ